LKLIGISWPDCGFGHQEIGGFAKDHEIFCVVYEHEDGRMVTLGRWLVEESLPQARLRADLVA
jgi:hypothetical protein